MTAPTALTNALLVRYAGGFLEVIDSGSIGTNGRVEGFLTLGNITDPTQATTIAQDILANTAQEQLTTTAEVEPASLVDIPYQGFTVGDTITVPTEDGLSTMAARVVSLTVTEDAEGNPIFAAELGVPAVLAEERWQNWLQLMLGGTMAGTASSAAPSSPPPPQQSVSDDEIISFHQPGHDSAGGALPLRSGEAGPQPVNRSGVLYKVVILLEGPLPGYGTGDNVCTIYVNHIPIGTATVHAGDPGTIAYFAKPVKAALAATADEISVQWTTVDGIALGSHIDVSIK